MAYEDIKNRNSLFSQAFGQPIREEIIPKADWGIDKSQNPDFAVLFQLGDLQKQGIGYEQAVEEYPRLAVYMKPTGKEVKARLKAAEEATSLNIATEKIQRYCLWKLSAFIVRINSTS